MSLLLGEQPTAPRIRRHPVSRTAGAAQQWWAQAMNQAGRRQWLVRQWSDTRGGGAQ